MKVMVLGIRGIPNVQGGVETHAEYLYPRLAAKGCDVEVIVRSPVISKAQGRYGTLRLRRIWAPRREGLEAMIHSVLGVLYAGVARPDILHIHAVGPAIVTPIARLLGLRVVVTHHGPDYDRDKWGLFARWVLRSGECMGMRWANARIAISPVISALIRAKYHKGADLIPNGIIQVQPTSENDFVLSLGLTRRQYILHVGRMVPEKRQLDLINAYRVARPAGWKLALVGGFDDTSYSRDVRAAAAEFGVVLTDFLKGAALHQIYSNAGAFVLPSSHEGLPIAMLEALSYGLPVLASDIPANMAVGLDSSNYFPVGDVSALAHGLNRLIEESDDETARAARARWVERRFDWDEIAEQTFQVYARLIRA